MLTNTFKCLIAVESVCEIGRSDLKSVLKRNHYVFCISRHYEYQSPVTQPNWRKKMFFVSFHFSPPPPPPPFCLLIPNSVDRWNLICEKWNRRDKSEKLNSYVSTALWIPGQCGTSQFLSLLSRITVSWNWKHREIQILTLPDICMTLGALNWLPPSAYASTYWRARQTMAFCGSAERTTAETKKQLWKWVFVLSDNII